MLFGRVYQLKIDINPFTTPDALENRIIFDQLRCAFQIKRFQGFSANTANIKIWNMNGTHQDAINRFNDGIILNVGYSRDAGPIQIFKGTTAFVSHKFTVPDVISTFECRSGEGPICERQLPFSYKANTPIYEMIQYIAQQCQLSIVKNFEVSGAYYKKGFETTGSVRVVLDKLCDRLDISWNIYNNELILLPRFYATNNRTVEISENTGLIGYPERFAYKSRWLPGQQYLPGYKVRTALLPTIDPGQSVRLISDSLNIDKEFFVLTATHTGDTHGEVWQSEFEVVQPNKKATQ